MKPHLILLHGALGATGQFDNWLKPLGEYFTLHAFDFEGHGAAPDADRPFRIEAFSDNLEKYLSDHQLMDVYIFGYSMGGYVALWLAHRQPALISKVVTLGTKFSWNPENASKEASLLNPEAMEEKIPDFAAALRQRHGDRWKTVVKKTAEMMLHLGEKPLLTDQVLKRITQESLICRGEKDRMVTENESEHAAAQLSAGHFLAVPELKHPLESADPAQFCKIIYDFVTESKVV